VKFSKKLFFSKNEKTKKRTKKEIMNGGENSQEIQQDILSYLSNEIKGRFGVFRIKSKDIFEKCRRFKIAEEAKKLGFYPYFLEFEKNEGPVAYVKGEKKIMLGSNNYLGLTHHPKVKEEVIKVVKEYGTSATGSRFLNGTLRMHRELEEELADFVGKEKALVFSTGYQTNLGILSALSGPNDFIICDSKCHASILDGTQLGAGKKINFKHNDIKSLKEVLSSLPENSGKLIVVDGVYSMDGDIAELDKIVEVSEKFNARIFVDDAHGLGVLGYGGRGTANHFKLDQKVDIIMGTFSKSFASIGGFVAGEKYVIDFIQHFGRSMIFSAALPPPCVAAVKASLKIMKENPEIAEELRKKGEKYREELKRAGFNIGKSQTPIVPIIIGDEVLTILFWKRLFEEGVYTNCVIPPAVPQGESLLRTSIMLTHTDEHIEFALEKIYSVGKELGII
jgi:8-amino-7-oxononanoate synthase